MSAEADNVQEKRLKQSFDALHHYFSPSRKQEGTGNPAQLVLFAEHAASNGCRSIAEESLQLYYSLDPPVNQFLIRAHLCKAMLTADLENTLPNLTEIKLSQTLEPILKAVSIASKSECYYFLVYNASVLLWQICRHFQRPGLRRLFARALRVVVKALDDCVQQEYPWKVELFMNLVLSQLDAGLRDEASKSCARAIQLATKHVPDKIVEVVRLHANYNLGDSRILSKELKQSPALMFISKLSRTKFAITYGGLSRTEVEQKLNKLYKLGTKEERSRTPSSVVSRDLSARPLGEAHPALILELGFLSLENSFHELARDCLHQVPKDMLHGAPKLYILHDLLGTQLLVEKPHKIYTKLSVETRVKAFGRLEQLLMSALRISDPDIVQHVSVVTWNFCLPLLQHNLRHLLRRPLTIIANALEGIQSLLYEMRVTIHFELAKISAQNDQLQVAIDHINKAILLDTGEKYAEQLKHYLHRFTLRAKIYLEPEANIDKAAKILEQCEDLISKDSADQLVPLLVKASNLLAPKHFRLALDGFPLPNTPEPKSTCESRASETAIDELEETLDLEIMDTLMDKGRMLDRHNVVSRHAQNHLSELGDQDALKRCQLWGDVAKLARKTGVWGVAATTAAFCLEYNTDGKLSACLKTMMSKSTVSERLSSPMLSQGHSSASSKPDRNISSKGERVNSSGLPSFHQFQLTNGSSSHSQGEESRHREEVNVIRTLAEVHCLLAECFVYQLKQEGLSPGQTPQLSAIGAENFPSVAHNEHWLSYTNWAGTLTKAAYDHFLKAAKLGVHLGEPHLVSNAAVYLWNYNHHYINAGMLGELIPTYRQLLAYMRKTPKLNDEEMVVRICTVLARGIAKKWTPIPTATTPTSASRARSARKSAKSRDARGAKKKGQGDVLQVEPEATPELKEAIEVCDHAMTVWNGVPLGIKRKLLSAWVQCRQLLHQSISTTTYDINELTDGSTRQCQVVVAIEMITRQGNKLWDFPNTPTLQQLFSMLSECEWSDYLLELELWTVLAQLSLQHKNFELVGKSAIRAIELHTKNSSHSLPLAPSPSPSQHPGNKHPPPPVPSDPTHRQESEHRSQAHSLQGQSLMARANGSVSMTREALEAFLNSARFGYDAGNYELVLSACSHYWNTCLPLSKQPMERILLRDQLTELLSIVAPLITFHEKKGKKSSENIVLSPEKRELLLSMCSVTFQAYIDKQSWEDGLRAVEQVMGLMPKSLQRDLIHYKLIFKSRLGRSVESDMIKFQEEAELLQSSLWHTVAVNAIKPADKLQAHQHAMQSLKSGQHPWIMINYLLELGEWLYQQQDFPLQDALDQFQRAVYLLLSLRERSATTEDGSDAGDEGGGEGEDDPGSGEKGERGESATCHSTPLPGPPRPLSHPVVPSPSTVSSVVQLETLVRVSVMMSQLHGVGTQTHWDLSLAALAYCSLIWKSVYSFYSKSEEGSKGSHVPPGSPQDWAEFQMPEQMLEYLKGNEDVSSLNMKTIQKPVLTLYYLDMLVKSLIQLGLHPLTLPVLNLQLALAHVTLTNTTALCSLLHMRIAQVCLDMGMLSSMPEHMELAGSCALIPDDLANSKVEMEMFRAKREALEEEESKGTLIALKSTTSAKNVTFAESVGTLSQTTPKQYQAYTVGEEVLVREVWVGQIRLLVQQGQYSKARELLNHASLESQCFDDHHSLFQIHINHALLSIAEKDSKQAVLSLVQALNLPCQLNSLMEGVLLLSEAVLESTEYRNQHSEVLDHMISLVDNISQRYNEESSVIKKAMHLLKARLALYDLIPLVEGSVTSKATTDILQLCGIITDSTKLLLEWGHYREAACVLQLTGRACRKLGERLEGEEHQQYILQSLSLHQKALHGLQTCYTKITSVCHSLDDIMSPVEAELIRTQFDVVETILLIFSEYSVERRKARSIQREKSSIQKMIDEYVREPPVLPFVERDWISTATVACDTALNLLASAHSLAKKDHKLKAKCTYLLGYCLCLMSEDMNPDLPQQWCELPPPPDPTPAEESGSGEQLGEVKEIGNKYSTVSLVVRQQEADEAEIEEEASLKCMLQAIHTLTEAISISISNKQWELAKKSALKLVDCVGVLDPGVSSLYLALYQSLAVSVAMSWFLQELQSDPKSSQLAALLCQREQLATHTPHSSPSIQTNSTLLSSFEAVQNLSVAINHLDLLKSFPPNFRFIVLQHSPDKSRLYAAYLIPPQPPPPSAHKKKEPPPEIEPLEPAICSAQVSPEDFSALEELMADYLELVHEQLCNPTSHVSEDDVEGMLTNVSKALDTYLAEVLRPITSALDKENVSKELSVVVLADMDLLGLPLETLSLLHRENIHSVSRDFSLQMLQHRMAKIAHEVAASAGKGVESKKKDKHPLPPASLAANITGFKYVLDPTNCMMDDDEGTNHSSKVLEQIHSFPKLTGKWSGFSSVNNAMSVSEWQTLLKESSGLVFFGTEKLLGHLPPQMLVSLNLPGCSFAMIMDSMSTPQSIVQQSNLDLHKTEEQFYYEHSLQTVLLLSMTGVGSVLANQWYTPVATNLDRTNRIIKELLSENKTVGKVHWLTKTKAKEEEPAQDPELEDSTENPPELPVNYNCVLYGLPHLTLAQ